MNRDSKPSYDRILSFDRSSFYPIFPIYTRNFRSSFHYRAKRQRTKFILHVYLVINRLYETEYLCFSFYRHFPFAYSRLGARANATDGVSLQFIAVLLHLLPDYSTNLSYRREKYRRSRTYRWENSRMCVEYRVDSGSQETEKKRKNSFKLVSHLELIHEAEGKQAKLA